MRREEYYLSSMILLPIACTLSAYLRKDKRVIRVGIATFALANAAAGSIAQYMLWKANKLPHSALGAFGLVLILLATSLQGIEPLIDILNNTGTLK